MKPFLPQHDSTLKHHLQRYFLVLVFVVFIAGIGGVALSLVSSSRNFIKQEAINAAEQTTNTLFSARDLYNTTVVQRLKSSDDDVPIIPNYYQYPDAIPVPATFLIELTKKMEKDVKNQLDISSHYYSQYPWYKTSSSGARDQFEQQALEQLAANPQKPFSRVENLGGKLTLRYATADVMKPACVTCHNTHPDSPKKDWRVGEMRGVLSVNYPLDQFQDHVNASFTGHFAFLGGVMVIGLGGLFLGVQESIRHQLRIRTNQTLQQVNQELENRVAQRTAALQQQQDQLQLQDQAIAASNNGIIIADAQKPDNPVVFVNQAFETMTGYSIDEVKGRNCRFLQGDNQNQPGLTILRTALKKGTSCKVTLHNSRKNGTKFWNELNISPIFNPQGKLTHFIGIQMDVTERIEAEEYTQQMNKQLKNSLQEKEILLKEIHHRVKNNLLIVSSLLNWQGELTQDPTALAILEDSQKRIKTLALVHEKMYQSKNLTGIDLGEYLNTLVAELLNSIVNPRQQITIEYNLCCLEMNIETVTPCGLIVNELVMNALEHAFPNGRRGKIYLGLTQTNNQIVLSVQDDGVGFPPGMDYQNSESMGWQLICLFAEQLEATLEVNHESGTSVKLTFSELDYHRRI